MKKLAFLVLFLTIIGSANGQTYPKGIYMSFDEIKARTPSLQTDLTVRERPKSDIFMYGGSDYVLERRDKTIKKSFLRKDILGYSDGDALYLNCDKLKTGFGYAKVIELGKYLIFKAGLTTGSEFEKKRRAKTAAQLRFIYAFDTDTQKLMMIDADTWRELVSSTPGDLPLSLENELDPNYGRYSK